LQQFADWIWAGIEWLTGWAPGEKLKCARNLSALLTAVLSIWCEIALIRGGGAATKKDVGAVAEDVGAVRRNITNVSEDVAALRAQMSQTQAALGGGAALSGAGAPGGRPYRAAPFTSLRRACKIGSV
jgi:hypothetical protein